MMQGAAGAMTSCLTPPWGLNYAFLQVLVAQSWVPCLELLLAKQLFLMLQLQYFGHLMQRAWCWERLRAEGEGGNRGWDGWMALLTQWTWVWANSRGWWRTGKPGVLQSMGLQRVRHDLVTEQQQQNKGISPKVRAPSWWQPTLAYGHWRGGKVWPLCFRAGHWWGAIPGQPPWAWLRPHARACLHCSSTSPPAQSFLVATHSSTLAWKIPWTEPVHESEELKSLQ